MEKCLVTKLLGSSSNTALFKIGEMRIKFDKVESPSKATQVFYLETSGETALEIIGDGYFTDETLSENKGKRILVKSPFSNLFVSNNNIELAVLNKYALTKLRSSKLNTFDSKCNNKEFSLSDVKFSVRLTDLNFYESPLSGDLSDLQRLTALQYLYLYSTQVYGDISNLKNLAALEEIVFECKDTSLTGDIGSLKDLVNLVSITLNGASLTGDVAMLSQTCKFVSLENNKNTVLTWSTRPTTAKILAIAGNAKITNIDKMLQDQAKCQVGFTSSDGIWYKTISVVGTRTSASDAAVSTLQSKGYTVTIIPE